MTYTPAKGSKEEKSEKLKPWTAPRRSNFIMIDPLSAKKYGHPSTRNPSGRSHASPVPHQRRGHKRTYANEKKIWINPTWVGEREWVSEGRTYKIISK